LKNKMYDLIIVGGGPAGITAGIYGSRKNLKTLLLTDNFIGQLGNAGVIENWPGEKKITGPELMDNFRTHLESYGPDIKEEKVGELKKRENKFEVKSENEIYEAKAVVVATGRNPRSLNIPGEERLVGKGVSYCVTCDGALFRGKTVVIIGGGNTGLEGALELSGYAEKVIVMEMAEKPAGDEFLLEKVKEKENTEVLTRVRPKKISGEDFVDGIEFENLETNELKRIEAEGIFVQIGSIPATEILGDLVSYNDAGEVEIDPRTCQTDTKGLFAAGDLTDVKGKQVVVAAGEGCKALLSAYDYIKNQSD